MKTNRINAHLDSLLESFLAADKVLRKGTASAEILAEARMTKIMTRSKVERLGFVADFDAAVALDAEFRSFEEAFRS